MSMKVSGPLKNTEEIYSFFRCSKDFGSLFILSFPDEESRCVCEVKNINDGLGEVSFIPIGEDPLPFEQGKLIRGINEANNVFFEATVSNNHGGKWLTIKSPSHFRMVNLRQNPRVLVDNKKLGMNPELTSLGDDGMKRLMTFEGDLIDISTNGASLEILAPRLDGYFKGDIVELKASERYAFLSRVRGQVVHKTLYEERKGNLRKYRIGIRFHQNVDIASLT